MVSSHSWKSSPNFKNINHSWTNRITCSSIYIYSLTVEWWFSSKFMNSKMKHGLKNSLGYTFRNNLWKMVHSNVQLLIMYQFLNLTFYDKKFLIIWQFQAIKIYRNVMYTVTIIKRLDIWILLLWFLLKSIWVVAKLCSTRQERYIFFIALVIFISFLLRHKCKKCNSIQLDFYLSRDNTIFSFSIPKMVTVYWRSWVYQYPRWPVVQKLPQ